MSRLSPGATVLNKYQVSNVLGEGGFGIAYRARDVVIGRDVVLKFLKPDDTGGFAPDTLRRFNREARAVGKLRSPYTPPLYEFGTTDDGVPFLVFELVDGENLADVLDKEGTFAEREVERFLRQLLHVLDEAHALGVLHRDIKPDNIILHRDEDGQRSVKLLDFGLAKKPGAPTHTVTEAGVVVGTPRYMSPEQLLDHELTPTSDLYSLGLLGYEMLLGPHALTGNSLNDQLARVGSNFAFDFPGSHALGAGLVEVIRGMTERAPHDRPSSARAVINQLNALEVSQTRPLDARRVAAPARTAAPNRKGLWLAAAMLLLVAMAIWARPNFEPQRSQPARATAHENAPSVQPTAPSTEPRDDDDGGTDEVVMSAGCHADERQPISTSDATRGTTRHDTFSLHIPVGYEHSVPHPLLVILHDRNEQAHEFLSKSRFPSAADEHGFIVVAPRSRSHAVVDTGHTGRNPFDDVAHVTDILRTTKLIRAGLCVDLDRLYLAAAGPSSVALQRAACHGWAGLATYAHQGQTRPFAECVAAQPAKLPKVLRILGRDDPRGAAFGGRDGCNGKEVGHTWNDMDRWWAEEYRCGWDEGTGKAFAKTERGDRCRMWECPRGTLRSCLIDGGGRWPGFPPRPTDLGPKQICDGDKTPTFAVEDEILRFFAATDDG